MENTQWVRYDELKTAVSLEMVLNHYGVKLRRENQHTLRGPCPLPMHGSKKSNTTFTANLEKGTGGAWACLSASCVAARGGVKGGNAIDLIKFMEGVNFHEAALRAQQWFQVHSSGPAAKPEGEHFAHVRTNGTETPHAKKRLHCGRTGCKKK